MIAKEWRLCRFLLFKYPILQSICIKLFYCFFGRKTKALLKMGIRGVTVSEVKGFGSQGGSTERHGGKFFFRDSLCLGAWWGESICTCESVSRFSCHFPLVIPDVCLWFQITLFSFIYCLGSEFSEDNFVAKVKMEIVVVKEQVK